MSYPKNSDVLLRGRVADVYSNGNYYIEFPNSCMVIIAPEDIVGPADAPAPQPCGPCETLAELQTRVQRIGQRNADHGETISTLMEVSEALVKRVQALEKIAHEHYADVAETAENLEALRMAYLKWIGSDHYEDLAELLTTMRRMFEFPNA